MYAIRSYYVVAADEVTVNITASHIEANLSNGLMWIENTCIYSNIEKNYIDTKSSKNFITMKNLVTESGIESEINVYGNTVVQSMHGVMTGT